MKARPLQTCALRNVRAAALACRSPQSPRLFPNPPAITPPPPISTRPFCPPVLDAPRSTRALHTSGRSRSFRPAKPHGDPQPTNFAELDLLADVDIPPTAVDRVTPARGFVLNSGVRVSDGSGILLAAGEAFRWRPWDAADGHQQAERKTGPEECVNARGQFEVPKNAFGVLDLLWPKPDLLIIGVGPTIRPLAPETRRHLSSLGLRVEVLDTRNAASQYTMLATERGQAQVAAVLMPL